MENTCPRCRADNPETQRFCGECGTPLRSGSQRQARDSPIAAGIPPSSMTETLRILIHELATGSTFAGRYQVIEELGHGGMGKVYKVFDTDIKEKIALKLLRPEIALDKETIERFSNELKLARKISHRNVCRMFCPHPRGLEPLNIAVPGERQDKTFSGGRGVTGRPGESRAGVADDRVHRRSKEVFHVP